VAATDRTSISPRLPAVGACLNCGHDNAEDAKFCSECGRKLELPAAASREVRKTVRVVFCDVTGSTALGERLDPESLRTVMSRYFDRRQVVSSRSIFAWTVIGCEPSRPAPRPSSTRSSALGALPGDGVDGVPEDLPLSPRHVMSVALRRCS
jgi:zinc-ribbon domain